MDYGSEMNLLVESGWIIDPLVLAVIGLLALFIVWLLGGGVEWIRTKLLGL